MSVKNFEDFYVTIELNESELGKRILMSKNMQNYYNCHQVDQIQFAQCFEVDSVKNVNINGCQLEYDENVIANIPTETFNMLFDELNISSNIESEKFPCERDILSLCHCKGDSLVKIIS